MPSPQNNSDNEYIEIASGEDKPVDLFGWQLKDSSKNKGYQFKEHVLIKPGDYFTIYKSRSKLALNDYGESVYLVNPQGKVVSIASYEKSSQNASFNFNGKTWKWSKFLTPGKKNKFDSEPTIRLRKIKRAYKGILTAFSARAKDKETKELKYAWDFGDGKKSYLANASHKYLDVGKYTVKLSVSDESQTVEKNFTLVVKKYPQVKIEIVKIIPNPAGTDSEGEEIDLKNNSGEKANLNGWKIATGSNGNVYNHPISDGVVLGSGETKKISREISRFFLNNKAGKVQLVSPDGNVADEVEYAKEKIAEGEVYAKINGQWQWIMPEKQKENTNQENTAPNENSANEKINETDDSGAVLGAANENEWPLTDHNSVSSSESAYIFFSRLKFLPSLAQKRNYCSAGDLSFDFVYLIAVTV